jgi:lipid II:glycine glycyltransferase (peptidoglycan interpeptide bridge formation enzyme)
VLKSLSLQGSILAGSGQRRRWDDFVTAHPSGHLLQSYAWGEFKRQHQWLPLRVIITEQGSERILAGAQILFRQMAGLSVAYIPKGAVVDWQDRPLVEALLDTVHRTAKRRRAIYLKIEPNEVADPVLEQRLGDYYRFKPSSETVQPKNTIRLDLTPSPEVILERMKSKTRYNIRLSERRGVSCRPADPADPTDFARFYRLMETTGQRDRFGIHSVEYYRDVWNAFNSAPENSGNGTLWLAEFEGQIIAGVMVFSFGKEAAYLYGASSDEHRREMPTYLIQWKAIQWAKANGAEWYDFWGIPDDIEAEENAHAESDDKNVRDGLWGVFRFKQGFGGEIVRYAGAFDFIYNRPMYLLWQRIQRNRM